MLRTLAFVFLAFVVGWDLISSGPREAAVTRASAHAYEWVRTEVHRHQLLDRAKDALIDASRAYSTAAKSHAPSVSPPPAIETVSVRPLTAVPAADAAAVAAWAQTAPTIAQPLATPVTGEVGDSVFAKDAILVFIAEAASRTGVSARYLEHLALRESSFNPVAAADTSSARGLYQFIESSWLDVFATHGAEHDQAELAALVTMSANGPRVSNERKRQQILDLRYDPKLATFLAAQFARDNRHALEAALGRQIDDAELYIAHFLGRTGAITLIEAKEDTPRASAADLFPWAARANRRYFYSGGREKSVTDLYNALVQLADEPSPMAALETEPA